MASEHLKNGRYDRGTELPILFYINFNLNSYMWFTANLLASAELEEGLVAEEIDYAKVLKIWSP